MAWAIRTFDLSLRYPNGRGIEGISLEVPRGAVYGFVGENGAGKTTCIKLLLGLLAPHKGRIEFFDDSHLTPRQRACHIGSLVEAPALYPHLTGRENLAITRQLLNLPATDIAPLLARLDLEDAADLRVGQYSMGMRQRLGLAQAMLGQPKLLVLDEPTNGLDPAGITDFRKLLCELTKNHGVTAFVSSHLLSELEQVATHVGILHEGALRFQGCMAQLRERTGHRIRFRCTQQQQALNVLEDVAGEPARLVDGWAEVAAPSTDLARLIQALFDAAVEVQDVAFERLSLEALFLQTVGKPAAQEVMA